MIKIINKWVRKYISLLSLSLYRVEKNILKQDGGDLSSSNDIIQRERQGMLSDDLLQGKITLEVVTLRARLYKILQASANYEHTGGDRCRKINSSISKKITGEPSDSHPVIMVIPNNKIPKNFLDSSDDIDTKPEVPIIIGRSIIPKFKIEEYTEKMYIKDIGNGKNMLEFFISKYRDIYDKKTSFLVKNIERSMINPKTSDFLDINEVGFITYNSIGVQDFLEFKYSVLNIHKIIEYNGYFVVKFICEPTVNGLNITDKYINEVLDNKYKNKEQKSDTL